jgi:hypothetical protein
MTKWLEWDFDNPAHRRLRREPVEILPPQQSARAHLEITIHHQRRPNLLPVFATVIAVLVLWRFKLGLLLLGALVGWQALAMFAFAIVIVALIARRERRAGRPF